MNVLEASLLGLVQGLTEFIPVSSSGHLILAREFFGFSGQNGLAFDAVLQLATGLAVISYFIKDMPKILKDKTLQWALVLGTLPAVFLGLYLHSYMESSFRSAHFVAWSLLAGSLLMYLADRFGEQNKELSVRRGLGIGFFQALALFPGFSRSGGTISGGLFLGLTREMATRFSFLLSVPIILGSGAKEFLSLNQSGAIDGLGIPLLIGSITAFISGVIAIHFLINYLKTHSLKPFIWYRVILAVAILLLV